MTNDKNIDKYWAQVFSLLSFLLQYLQTVQKVVQSSRQLIFTKVLQHFCRNQLFEMLTVFGLFLCTLVKTLQKTIVPGTFQQLVETAAILVFKICFTKHNHFLGLKMTLPRTYKNTLGNFFWIFLPIVKLLQPYISEIFYLKKTWKWDKQLIYDKTPYV